MNWDSAEKFTPLSKGGVRILSFFLSSLLVLIPFLISKIFAVQMWGVGIAGGLLPGAAEGIRRLPGARPAGSALPAKLEKLKYNIFGLHINSPHFQLIPNTAKPLCQLQTAIVSFFPG